MVLIFSICLKIFRFLSVSIQNMQKVLILPQIKISPSNLCGVSENTEFYEILISQNGLKNGP
jgi:hypothetical protein